jgi:hypothetical protein
MARNVAQQLIESHLISGEMQPGAEIALSVDYDRLGQGDVLTFTGLREQLSAGQPVVATTSRGGHEMALSHQLSGRQIEMVLAGGRIPLAARDGGAARDSRVSDPGGAGQ